MKKIKRLVILLPGKLRNHLKARCAEEGVTMTAVILRAIREFLLKEKKQCSESARGVGDF